MDKDNIHSILAELANTFGCTFSHTFGDAEISTSFILGRTISWKAFVQTAHALADRYGLLLSIDHNPGSIRGCLTFYRNSLNQKAMTNDIKIYWSNSQFWYIINRGNIITAYYNKNLKDCNRVPYINVASAVKSAGGLDAFKARLITPDEAEARLSALDAAKAERAAREAADWAKAEAAATEARIRLTEAEKAGPIAPTESNIRDLLLSVQHNCAWPLPQFAVGYTVNRYDCNGRIAATAEFDTPVIINGQLTTCVCLGAPRGYLNKYARL